MKLSLANDAANNQAGVDPDSNLFLVQLIHEVIQHGKDESRNRYDVGYKENCDSGVTQTAIYFRSS